MNIVTYNYNNNFNNEYIEDLLINKEKLIIDDKKFYFKLSVPLIDYNNEKKIIGSNTKYEIGLDYSNLLTEKIENIYIYDIIFYLEKEKYIIVDDIDKFSFINKNNKILKIFIDIIDKCERDYRRHNDILYIIKKHVTWVDYFNGYKLIEYVDKLLYYAMTYNNLINDMIMIVSRIIIIIDYDKENKKNNDYELFKNRIKVFQNNITVLKDDLEQTRHGTMQRIAYLDSGTSRILTIVASIFLPTTFLISLLSMPFKGIPFKNNKYGYFIVLFLITIIFIILIYLFYKDFANLFINQ
jgi:hypothetical protein